MAFEINRITSRSTGVEVAAYKGRVEDYLMQVAHQKSKKRKKKWGKTDFSPEKASKELAAYYVGQVLQRKMCGLLAYDSNRDKSGKIIIPSFNPQGHMLYSASMPEYPRTACIEQLFAEDQNESIELLLMQRFVREMKKLKGKKFPERILLKTLLNEGKNVENYARLGFLPTQVIESGKVMIWWADYNRMFLR